MIKVPNGRTAVNAYYGAGGDKNSTWYKENIISLTLPFPLLYEGKTVKSCQFHRLAAPSLLAVLLEMWLYARTAVKKQEGYDLITAEYDRLTLAWLDARGVREYGGTYKYRNIRGSSRALSTHALGIAIDIMMSGNALGDSTPSMPEWIIAIFRKHGFVWGGDFSRKDGMHFQLAKGV